MKTRAFINLTLAVDLDMMPGWGHSPTDWVALLRGALAQGPHYHPELTTESITEVPYTWNEVTEKYDRPCAPAGEPVDTAPVT
jgi:hypothetical protein